MDHTRPPANPPDDPMDRYVGLQEATARDEATARGWSRVRSLPPGAVITMEYMVGRINFTVDDGRVTRAWPG
jgi:Peptidase inhibitor I78 family